MDNVEPTVAQVVTENRFGSKSKDIWVGIGAGIIVLLFLLALDPFSILIGSWLNPPLVAIAAHQMGFTNVTAQTFSAPPSSNPSQFGPYDILNFLIGGLLNNLYEFIFAALLLLFYKRFGRYKVFLVSLLLTIIVVKLLTFAFSFTTFLLVGSAMRAMITAA